MPTFVKYYTYSIIVLFLLFSSSCSTEQKTSDQSETQGEGKLISITGTFETPQKGRVVLKKLAQNQPEIVESTEIDGQKFEMKIDISEPDFYILTVSEQDIPLVLNDTDIKVSLDTRQAQLNYKVEGGKDNVYYQDLESIIRDYQNKVNALRQENVDNPDKAMSEIQAAYIKVQKESVVRVKDLINNSESSIVLVRAASLLDPEEENEFLNQLISKLEKELPNSKYTKEFSQHMVSINQKIEATKHLAVGKPAPDISLESPDGQVVKLSSLKGKLVLLDFWASWCKPCRAENPNVVRMYDKYKNKGFEIYGVSLDQSRDAWLKAIKDDGLNWLHVSDLRFWQSEAAQTYHIQAIPQTYLIGSDGMIVAKNLRGPALEQKVGEILN